MDTRVVDRAGGELTPSGPTIDFDAWVRPHLPAMTRLAARLTAPSDAPDVVQDALARAWRVRQRYDPDRGSPSAFLLAIVADQARQHRRRRRWPLGTQRDAADDVTDRPAEPDVVADVDLQRAVSGLPARQRLAVDCVYFAGLSIAETAAVMRCAEGTVKSTLSDARAHLRTALEDS